VNLVDFREGDRSWCSWRRWMGFIFT